MLESGSNPPCLRRTVGNKMYTDDLGGRPHADGEIWSRALWDMRNVSAGPVSDQLVLEHHFALPSGSTMPTAALALLDADTSINGGSNHLMIRTAFCDRGILEGANCAGTGDELFENGFE